MEGMSHLVDQDKDIVQGPVVVEQHVGMDPVNAAGIGPAALALIFQDVDPPLLIGPADHGQIVLSQRGQSLQGDLLCLVVGDLHLEILHDGGIYVVHMELVHSQHLFAQADIAVHLVEAPVDRLDQVVADGGGHVHPGHGGLEGGRIVPCPGKEDLLTDLSVIEGRQGIAELLIGAVELLEDLPAQIPVRRHLQRDKSAARDLDLLTVLHGRGEFHVRVRQHAEGIDRDLGHFPGRSQKTLRSLIQGVIL